MQAAVRAAKGKAKLEIVPQLTPVASSASLGRAEQAFQTICGNFRAIKSEFESKTGLTVGPTSIFVAWMIRHAAWCYNRFYQPRGATRPTT
eukprot:91527-Alexandrium_andersonii.AAC.1